MDQDPRSEIAQRKRQALSHALGEPVMSALADPQVVEVMLNDDGSLWVERLGDSLRQVGSIGPDDAMTILNVVADAVGEVVSKELPFVEGELLLLDGERFMGIAPPVAKQGIFAIRKKATQIFDLKSYIRAGVLTFTQAETIREQIIARRNILVVGGTSSGKTTFCNALLKETSSLVPNNRMLIIEDTQELQCSLKCRLFLRSSPWTSMADISPAVNRLRPDSITVGEMRAGGPALALLKLWNTGHEGGMSTIHANSAYEGLIRLDQLIQEVSAHPQRMLIGGAVNVVVFLKKEEGKRRVKQILQVHGYDEVAKKFLTKEVL